MFDMDPNEVMSVSFVKSWELAECAGSLNVGEEHAHLCSRRGGDCEDALCSIHSVEVAFSEQLLGRWFLIF